MVDHTRPHTPEELLTMIQAAFPEVAGNSFKHIDEGWDHEVMIVDDTYVFRFPRDKEYQQLLGTEISVLKRLQPLVRANIPEYSLIAPGTQFAGYRKVPGTNLDPKYVSSLPASALREIAHQQAEFLTTLHTLHERQIQLDDVAPWYLVKDQSDLKHAVIKHLVACLSAPDLAIVNQIVDEVDQLLEHPSPRVFIHNDFYSRHLFWDETPKRLGVIDFSDMCMGDPAVDFAELFEYGPDYVKQVYGYYRGPKDVSFLSRAWTYQKWIAVYMMVDYFDNHKTSFAVARQTFDRIKTQEISV